MSIEKKISVIVPAYNEESVIGDLLQELKAVLSKAEENHEVIVVDDGSTDETYSVSSSISGVRVVRHPYNKGNGAAVKTGIQKARGERLIIIDADGQHDPKYILEMLGLLDNYDLVVGARESFGLGRRGAGNLIVSKIATYLAGITIPDLTCGFRAFKKDKMLEFIHILPNKFSLPSTSTLAFAMRGYNIKFIPILGKVRQGGKSSIKLIRDGMKFIVLIVRMISLFNPLKVFAPVSIMLLLFGSLWSLRAFSMTREISSLGTMILLAGIFVFFFGLLADQIAETKQSIGKILKSQIDVNDKDTD
jgi:glycosyltransferase involved in cell wall biosynthesis